MQNMTLDPTLLSFMRASYLSGYPDADTLDKLQALMQAQGEPRPGTAALEQEWTQLKNALQERLAQNQGADDWRSEYIDLFDRGRSQNPINETEFGKNRTMFKARELSDIAGFYKAFGYDLSDETESKEMVDHVAVELEFYSLLLMKMLALKEADDQTGCEIVLDARKKFLQDHLGRFVSAIAARQGVQDSAWFGPIFRYCASVVQAECSALGVTPETVGYFDAQKEPESMNCGATGNCAIPN